MNHNCDNCGRLGDTVQIVSLEYLRGWRFWKKYHVLRKFCTFGCLNEYCHPQHLFDSKSNFKRMERATEETCGNSAFRLIDIGDGKSILSCTKCPHGFNFDICLCPFSIIYPYRE